NLLSVVFQGGKGITVSNPAGSVAITRPGFGTMVRDANQRPMPPARLTPEALTQLTNDLQPGGQEELTGQPETAPTEDGAGAAPEASGEAQPTGDQAVPPAAEETPTAEDAAGAPPPVADEPPPAGDQPPAASGGPAPPPPAEEPKPLIASAFPTNPQPDTSTPAPPPAVAATTAVSTTSTAFTSITTQIDPIIRPGLSGGYIKTLTDSDFNSSTGDSYGWGTTAGSLTLNFVDYQYNASVSGTATITSPAAASQSFSFTQPVLYDPDSTYYSGGLEYTGGTYPGKIYTTNLLEFVAFGRESTYSSGGLTYTFQEMGFMGTPTAAGTFPTTGVTGYMGGSNYVFSNGTTLESGGNELFMEVNWYAKKFFGMMFEHKDESLDGTQEEFGGPPVIFYGSVNPAVAGGIDSTVRFLGGGGPGMGTDVATIYGSASLANFYGSKGHAVGMTTSGDVYSVYDGTTNMGTWYGAGAGVLEIDPDPVDLTSPTGTVPWSGFVAAVGENMDAPTPNNNIVLVNNSATGVALSLNRDAGTVSGTITADNVGKPSTPTSVMINVGETIAAGKSAYVLDDAFVAELSGTNINNYGNFLVTEDPDRQYNDYVTWGYWDMAYDAGTPVYHVHTPTGMWVAGKQTPIGYFTSSFTGTYTGVGQAQCVEFMPNGIHNMYKDGDTNLSVNFSTSSVSGSLTFKDPTKTSTVLSMNIGGGVSLSSSGFSAQITQINKLDPGTNTMQSLLPSTNGVRGAFYGDQAQAVAGNFHARVEDGSANITNQFVGIFSGLKQ
ncbi:MAG: transferrin-binding protein-like solute binding protein, partial [Desulfobulbaceae bacterium]|nr:transferrin-binding protein-like solute binding protein [Desulfobulbaceae bacterium]